MLQVVCTDGITRSPCRNISIKDLANELLSQIGGHLPREDLASFRAVGSHEIRNGTDYELHQRLCNHRVRKINDASIRRLSQMTRSRFAKSIRGITIGADLDYQGTTNQTTGLEASQPLLELRHIIEPQELSTAMLSCADELYKKLAVILRGFANLKCISICPPSLMERFPDEAILDVFDPSLRDYEKWLAELSKVNSPSEEIYRTSFLSHQVYSGILAAIAKSRIQLDELRILGYTQPKLNAQLAQKQSMCDKLVSTPGVRKLTRLEVDFGLFPGTAESILIGVAALITYNPRLQVLKVSMTGRAPEDDWLLLLCALANDPPFQLRELYLSGGVIQYQATLDDVIRKHSETLRHMVLSEISFNWKDSVRSVYSALARTKVNFFATRSIWLSNARAWWTARTLIYKTPEKKDEALVWDDADAKNLDTSYQGWVEIDWRIAPATEWVPWYDARKQEEVVFLRAKMLAIANWIDNGRVHCY